ncbi:MAG TPA: glycosyltransferase [Planctomycetota bacterium]|jgi:glycosyltransferase involved in cell wall biosynthesis|nr:glycosyltransferase [Planctomycetota bacterium]
MVGASASGRHAPEKGRGGAVGSGRVSLVCFSYDPWGAYEKNIHRLMRRLAHRPEMHRALFVEPEAWASRLLQGSRRREPGEEEARRRALRGALASPDERIAVWTPVHRVPFAGRAGWLRALDRGRVRAGLRRAMRRLGIAGPLLWVNRPAEPWLLEAAGPSRGLVLHWSDDWEAFASPPEREPTRRRTEALLRRADLVFAVSPGLRARAEALNPNAFLLPNATDPAFFEAAGDPATAPAPELADLPRPILGFVGFLSPRLDFPLLEAIARRRPEWTFAFVGPERRLAGAGEAFFSLPNVRRLGPRPAAEIPRYYRGMDVCLVPFRRDESTRDADAIKLYEYLAAGRPVVATDAAGADRAREFVRVAEGAEAFERAVREALARHDPGEVERGRAFARRNSWEARAQEVVTRLAERGLLASPDPPGREVAEPGRRLAVSP